MDENKMFLMTELKESFIALLNKLAKMPGAPIQKQQAFLRFDEGHMWMQNSIMSYTPPSPPAAEQESNPVQPPLEQPEPPTGEASPIEGTEAA